MCNSLFIQGFEIGNNLMGINVKEIARVVVVSCVLFAMSCFKGPTSGAFLSVNHTRCSGCTECLKVCPSTAVTMIGEKAYIDPTECIECGKCVEVCRWNAIQ